MGGILIAGGSRGGLPDCAAVEKLRRVVGPMGSPQPGLPVGEPWKAGWGLCRIVLDLLPPGESAEIVGQRNRRRVRGSTGKT